MEGSERDRTEDWLVPEDAAPATVGELELRVDEALAIARSSEEAVNVIGDAALEAAKQAGRAAELAESASAAALEARQAVLGRTGDEVGSVPEAGLPAPDAAEEATATWTIPAVPAPPAGNGLHQERLRRFTERADRVAARLQAI